MKQQPPANTTDFVECTRRVRLAYSRLLDEAEAWAEENHVPVDVDIFAIFLAARLHAYQDAEVTWWTRRMVNWISGHVPEVCEESGVELPDDYLVQLELFLDFLDDSDWLDDWSDRLSALMQPLRCGLPFLVEDEPIPPGFHDVSDCYCTQKFRGRSHGFTRGRRSA